MRLEYLIRYNSKLLVLREMDERLHLLFSKESQFRNHWRYKDITLTTVIVKVY